MNFNSGAFLLYLPVTFAVYWLLPHRFRWMWLLAASWFFYMYFSPILIVLLLATTLVSYGAAVLITRFPQHKKLCLTATLIVCLGILGYFKYANFFLSSIYAVIGRESPTLNILLPVGISFYTFQTLSYVIDVYRGDYPAETHLGYYALFVVFFPQLVAGPIESPRDLLPQLKAERTLKKSDLSAGIRLMLCGYFRKCVVADLCGLYVNRVFADLGDANALAVAGAGALFCIQMYCDFAGYSEIAAGCARLLGIRLTRNFNRPYLSQSYTEFFRRWHISLNRWFTQYLYIPLGGNRRGQAVKIRNTIIVFALCGLWHGASWTYVLWGLYAAFFVSLEGVIRKPVRRFAARHGINLHHPLMVLARRIGMFFIFIPAALLFRSQSIGQIGDLARTLVSGDFALSPALSALGLNGASLALLVLILCAMTRLHVWGEFDLAPAENATIQARRDVGLVLMTIAIALSWLALLATQDAAGFAYFQF